METTKQSRKYIHEARSFGERIADAVANGMGSWRFIIIQSIIVALWIMFNVWLLKHPFDPYPLILLNLLFSTQAAYAAPVIMMAQNRQATIDRARDDHEADEVDLLFKINRQQLEILRLLHAKVAPDTPIPTPEPPAPKPRRDARGRFVKREKEQAA